MHQEGGLSLPGNQNRLEFDVFCDERAHHGILTQRCFSIMQKSLHFNIHTLIDKTFSPTVQYVSRYWARHSAQAAPVTDDTDDLICGLKDFLCNTLLFWIEAMNLLGAESECFSSLNDVGSWTERGKEWPDLQGELMDAANFSAFFAGSPASKATPHLYISALSMWNQDSAIWRKWRDRFAFIPSISLPSATITIPLMTIRTADFVNCIGFSPDGNRIGSGSADTVVRIWDVKTGEQLKELQGHTETVWSVAFSPDGDRIVFGSGDKSVQVWDAKTGEQLKELQGHTDGVFSVAFSPDGNQIVSGSLDKSVRMWGNLNIDAPWVVKEDGWTISGADRLVWVPSTICNVLLRPPNMLIISRNGSATLSFEQCKLGTLWHECYTP